MARSIVAVVVSYIAGTLFFFAVVTACFFGLGVERVFEPFSYEISPAWLSLTLITSLVSASLAGYLCLWISRSWRACQILAFIVFFLTLLNCFLELRRINPDAPNTRAGEVGYFDAMNLGVPPRWFHFVTPVVGGIGVLLGARFYRATRRAAT